MGGLVVDLVDAEGDSEAVEMSEDLRYGEGSMERRSERLMDSERDPGIGIGINVEEQPVESTAFDRFRMVTAR